MNNRMCYLMSNTVERRAGWKEEQREREKQGERGRAGEEQCKGWEETTLSSDSSDRCRIKIVKTIFFCGLQMIYRKARDWSERLVSGRRRQRMNWSRRWAEHHYNQHHFFQALAEKGRVEVSEMGLMKYRSEMVTPLHQWSLQARTRYLCLISSFFRLWLQRRAGWEKQRDRERQCEGGRAQEQGKCI